MQHATALRTMRSSFYPDGPDDDGTRYSRSRDVQASFYSGKLMSQLSLRTEALYESSFQLIMQSIVFCSLYETYSVFWGEKVSCFVFLVTHILI